MELDDKEFKRLMRVKLQREKILSEIDKSKNNGKNGLGCCLILFIIFMLFLVI